jgi:hypothetical protein
MKNLVIVALIIFILFLLKGAMQPLPAPIITTTIDTLYKDTTITKWKKGKDILRDTTIYDTIPQLVAADTMAILKDYFAKNVYKDTLTLPEGSVSILDTISQNKILGRSYQAKITQKTIREVRELRTPPPPPKAALYWGVMGIQNQDKTFGYGGGIIYKSPNKGIIQLNYTNSKQIQLGYYSKIF